jgi:acyl dehydratase
MTYGEPAWVIQFDDIELGTRWNTRERIVTGIDILAFAALSGDFGSLHVDEDYCRRSSIYGTRVAHGIFGLSVVTGLLRTIGMTEDTLIALAGVRWSMRLPIIAGDALHVQARVTGKRSMARRDRGVVFLDASLVNQRLDVVQRGSLRIVLRRGPVMSSSERDDQRSANDDVLGSI